MNNLDQREGKYQQLTTEQPLIISKFDPSEHNYGRMYVFRQDSTGKPTIIVGPHWWCSLIGLSFVTGGTGILLSMVWNVLPTILLVILLISFGFTFSMYTFMIFSNPGVIPQNNNPEYKIDKEDIHQYSCHKCLTLKAQKAVHCKFCDVCIDNYDHHCVWLGKCIGRKTIVQFYVFVASVFTLNGCILLIGYLMKKNFLNDYLAN